MKNATTSSIVTKVALALVMTFAVGSCKEAIEDPVRPALIPAKIDSAGGTWKPVVMRSDSMATVPAPPAVTDPLYVNDMTESATIVANLSGRQRDRIRYWSSGAVIRWNEIARALIAKYNIVPELDKNAPPPYYPVTSPPFANPPTASRVYAYLSVGQFDALIATWNEKYRYNRNAAVIGNGQIHNEFPRPSLPSYPSEHAVIARVSAEILKALFPLEKDYLESLAKEAVDSRLWAGANLRHENAAGEQLGTDVAKIILARAATDGMKDAAKYDTIKYPKGVWQSLDIPRDGKTVRNAMLPSFGKVRCWNVPDPVAIRPDPPLPYRSPEHLAQVQEVKNTVQNLTKEQWRIAAFWADGEGTHTPPGHWNQFTADAVREARFSELRCARTFALVNMAMMDGGITCWDVKYTFNTPRPQQVDPSITTVTGVPNFPGFTSGHSTFSAAAAAVLGYVFPEKATMYEEMAQEASVSRIYAGIHLREDCEVGLVCGRRVAAFTLERARIDGAQ